MTEVTLKLYPLPEAVSAAVCHFADIAAAVKTTIQIIQIGVPIARCELLDANAVRAVNAHDKLALREAPMLLMEFHGSAAGVQEQAETVQEIAREHGGEDFQWASTPEERTRLWTARHHAYFAGTADEARLPHRDAPTPACRSRVWPSASTLADDGSRGGGHCRTTSSATSATATSTSPT